RRAQTQLQAGELPAAEIVNGLLILVGGALLLVPGFVTDLFGLVLLVPPSRALVRTLLLRRFEKRVRAAFEAPAGSSFGASRVQGRVFTGPATVGGRYDVVDVREVEPDDRP